MAIFTPFGRQRIHRRHVLGEYADKVMGYSPIAYWPLNEPNGTTAYCMVNGAQNGTYSSDVSSMGTGTGIGDGNTAAYFDGTNDYVNIMTATLSGAWNFAEGSMGGWAKVNAAGVWTDAATRAIMRANGTAPSVQGARLLKSNANNRLDGRRWASGNFDDLNYTPFSDTDWFPWVLTWSETANELLLYVNGAEVASNPGINASVAGSLFIAFIGSESAAPASPWHGWQAHVFVYDKALSAAECANLAVV